MGDEGYIKFKIQWENKPIKVSDSLFVPLNYWRSKLHELSLIGMYPNGIGFGNISMKESKNSFIISGSATGKKAELAINDYSRVESYNIKQNSVACTGETKASSESLTHAAIYSSIEGINTVIHIHSKKMWCFYKEILATTGETIPYGTPEIAFAIKEILARSKNNKKGCIIMGGHEEGILVYGESIDLAGNYLLELYHQSLNSSAIS